MEEELKNQGGCDPKGSAFGWFVRLNGEPSEQDRQAFAEWIEAAPRNRESYAAAESLWRELDDPSRQVAAERHARIAPFLAHERRPKARRRLAAGLSIAACLVGIVLLAGLWLRRPHLLQDLAADQSTPRGVRRLVTLPDGSTALLDADSALALEYGGRMRGVKLLRGRAFFSVLHSPVPFHVDAANGEEQVLGTRFEVALLDHDAIVTVAEGRVAVVVPGYPAATLTAAEQVSYGPGGLGQVASVDLAAASAWQRGRLVFYRVPLSKVVEAIARNYPGRIVILNRQLADQRVTVNFPADPETALASLQDVVGFRRYTIVGCLILLR